MKDTGYYVPPAKTERLAGYPEPNKPTQTKPAKFQSGGDGLYGSAPDYLQFAKMLLNKGELGGTRILKARSIAAPVPIADDEIIGYLGAGKGGESS